MGVTSEPGPGNLLDLSPPAEQVKETVLFVDDPQVPRIVFADGKHISAGNAADGSKPVMGQVANAAIRRDPDLPGSIQEKRLHPEFDTVRPQSSVTPSVQASTRANQNASITGREDGSDNIVRQPLVHGKRGNGEVAKAVEAVDGGYPDAPLTSSKSL
jgi:hypothetical protein